MRIAIYGAGSLGIVLGAYLARAGLDVDLVNRNKEHVDALRRFGARVRGAADLTVPVKALLPEEMKDGYDLILLLTKVLDNRKTAQFLKPFLGRTGVVCTLQNGIPEPALAEVLGRDRVYGCIVAWGATLTEPGLSRLTSDPRGLSFGMGSLSGKQDKRYDEIKGVLKRMCPVETEGDLLGARWSKLLINAAFSGVGTVMGGSYGDVVDNKKARKLAQRVMKECIDVGRAQSISFAKVQGKDVAKLMDYGNAAKRFLAYLIIPLAMKKHRAVRPSMLQDLEAGKACEIDAINGAVSSYGRARGVPTPFNDRVVELVKEIQAGKRKRCPANLDLFDAPAPGR